MPRFLLIISLALFYSCQTSPPSDQLYLCAGTQMTMNYKIMVGSVYSEREAETIKHCIMQTFSEVDAIYNKWNPESELSQLNRLAGGLRHSISPKLYKLLQLTDRIHAITKGKFDPTIEPLQKLWKEYLTKGEIPPKEELDHVKASLGWDKIHFTSEYFWKDHSSTSLDLGGIAKGYCIDLLLERIKALGHQNIYVEWGGEIRTSGTHPSGRPWRIFIAGLQSADPSEAQIFLELQDEAIATSGDYLQYWKVGSGEEEKNYFHIFDRNTLAPLTQGLDKVASASVCAETCALADGLATAAMMFDNIKEAQEWADNLTLETKKPKFWLYTRTRSKNN